MKRYRTLNRIFAILLTCAATAGPWGGPVLAQDGEAASEVRSLIDAIRAELDRGETERLVDPWFLRDLRAILDRYDWPWRVRLLVDDFSGQGPGPDAPWQVTAGEFLIDWRHGLRSVIKPPRQSQTGSGQSQQDDAVKALVGTLLTQALGGQQESGQQESGQQSAAEDAAFAAMIAPLKVTNAFALNIEMTSRPVDGARQGRFEVGPYQGEGANAGYRLAYIPGATAGSPSMELLRVSPRGTVATLEYYDQPLDLEDGRSHRLVWTRNGAGVMVVELDGEILMEATDRGFREDFDGLAVVNSGGDFALRRLTLDGAG